MNAVVRLRRFLLSSLPFVTYCITILFYALPLYTTIPNDEPVLDELHLLTDGSSSNAAPSSVRSINRDVLGASTLSEVLTNDYWGRPITSPHSHRSWRPVTVLTFRWFNASTKSRDGWLKGLSGSSGSSWGLPHVFVHRLVNVLLHAGLAQLVGVLAVHLFFPVRSSCRRRRRRRRRRRCPKEHNDTDGGRTNENGEDEYNGDEDDEDEDEYDDDEDDDLLLRTVTRNLAVLLFASHPTHVEVVANAANRPHVLCLLMSIVALDPDDGAAMIKTMTAMALGLLCGETAVFQVPAVAISMTVLKWRRTEETTSTLKSTMISLLPRYLALLVVTATYLTLRHAYDTLSIPEGLIHRAENPFRHLTGSVRFRSYAYVLSIHVAKSLWYDPLGFAHEYNYDCIPVVERWTDVRLLLPLGFVVVVVVVVGTAWVVFCAAHHGGGGGLRPTMYLLFGSSWYVTLIPVSGLMKVGTFVADRMVVPCTVASAVCSSRLLAGWVLGKRRRRRRRQQPKAVPMTMLRGALVAIGLGWWGRKVSRRCVDWTSSAALFRSALRSCPRSAKTNLQMSKVHSGTIDGLLNLDLALSYVQKAESIDPDFCKVHYQFAHVLFQQEKYFEFEERLTEAIICAHTTDQAMDLWDRYWPIVISDASGGKQAAARRETYTRKIQSSIQHSVGSVGATPSLDSTHSSSHPEL